MKLQFRNHRFHRWTVCKLLLIVAVIATGNNFGFAQDTAGEKTDFPPTYKGRTFEAWQRLLPNDLDNETRADAYRAMSAFSRIPKYTQSSLNFVKSHLPQERSRSVLEVAYQNLPGTDAEDYAIRLAAVKGDDREHRRAAIQRISQTAPDATQELAEAIGEVLEDQEETEETRLMAIRALQNVASRKPTTKIAENIADVLIAVISNKDEEAQVRYEAVGALGWITSASEYRYEPSDSRRRQRVKIRPEGEYGPIVKKVTPVLKQLLDDDSRENGGRTIGDLVWRTLQGSLPSEIAVPVYIQKLQDILENPEALQLDRPRPNRQMLTAHSQFLRLLSTLESFGSQAKDALPLLETFQQDHPELNASFQVRISKTIRSIEDRDTQSR